MLTVINSKAVASMMTTADLPEAVDKRFVSDAQKTVLGNTSGINTGDQDLSGYASTSSLSAYVPTSRKVNGHALSADVTVSKSDVGLGSVPNTDCTTTANITDSFNKRFITDAQQTVLGNTSGTNTGDQNLSGYVQTTRTVAGHALSADVTVSKSDVGLGSVLNTDCTTTANITDSTNKRFITDAQQMVLGNTSGTNTGDQDLSGKQNYSANLDGWSAIATSSKADTPVNDRLDSLQQDFNTLCVFLAAQGIEMPDELVKE